MLVLFMIFYILGYILIFSQDLFSANYQSYPMPAPGWQTGPAYGFNMQYNVAAVCFHCQNYVNDLVVFQDF